MVSWCDTLGCKLKFTVWFIKEWFSSLGGNLKSKSVPIRSLNRIFTLRRILWALTLPWKAARGKQRIEVSDQSCLVSCTTRIMLCGTRFLSYASRNAWHKNKWRSNFRQKFLKTCPVQDQLVFCNITSKTKEIRHYIFYNNSSFFLKGKLFFNLVISTLFKWNYWVFRFVGMTDLFDLSFAEMWKPLACSCIHVIRFP